MYIQSSAQLVQQGAGVWRCFLCCGINTGNTAVFPKLIVVLFSFGVILIQMAITDPGEQVVEIHTNCLKVVSQRQIQQVVH